MHDILSMFRVASQTTRIVSLRHEVASEREAANAFRLVSKPVSILSSVPGNREIVEPEETPKKRFIHQTKSGKEKDGRVNVSESS